MAFSPAFYLFMSIWNPSIIIYTLKHEYQMLEHIWKSEQSLHHHYKCPSTWMNTHVLYIRAYTHTCMLPHMHVHTQTHIYKGPPVSFHMFLAVHWGLEGLLTIRTHEWSVFTVRWHVALKWSIRCEGCVTNKALEAFDTRVCPHMSLQHTTRHKWMHALVASEWLLTCQDHGNRQISMLNHPKQAPLITLGNVQIYFWQQGFSEYFFLPTLLAKKEY